MNVNHDSIKPGSKVKIKGIDHELYNGNIDSGDSFPAIIKKTDIDYTFNNKVTIVSIVTSVDTKVCEQQTHILGESGIDTNKIELVTISRDLPMAQERHVKESGLSNIKYYSDYKTGSFGKLTGLMIRDIELLTRGVLVLDQNGVIRYTQFVSEITELPDMKKAFDAAKQLAGLAQKIA